MLRFKKCDKKFPRMESESRDENEPQDPGPRVERRRDDPAPLPGHRHHPGQPAARGNTTQRPAQQDQQMLRWIHSHSLVMTLQPEVFHHSDYIASYVSCVTCQVDKYAVSRPQLQDNSCRSQLFIGYWCMEAWRGPRICDWPSGKQMLTCRYCH